MLFRFAHHEPCGAVFSSLWVSGLAHPSALLDLLPGSVGDRVAETERAPLLEIGWAWLHSHPLRPARNPLRRVQPSSRSNYHSPPRRKRVRGPGSAASIVPSHRSPASATSSLVVPRATTSSPTQRHQPGGTWVGSGAAAALRPEARMRRTRSPSASLRGYAIYLVFTSAEPHCTTQWCYARENGGAVVQSCDPRSGSNTLDSSHCLTSGLRARGPCSVQEPLGCGKECLWLIHMRVVIGLGEHQKAGIRQGVCPGAGGGFREGGQAPRFCAESLRRGTAEADSAVDVEPVAGGSVAVDPAVGVHLALADDPEPAPGGESGNADLPTMRMGGSRQRGRPGWDRIRSFILYSPTA